LIYIGNIDIYRQAGGHLDALRLRRRREGRPARRPQGRRPGPSRRSLIPPLPPLRVFCLLCLPFAEVRSQPLALIFLHGSTFISIYLSIYAYIYIYVYIYIYIYIYMRVGRCLWLPRAASWTSCRCATATACVHVGVRVGVCVCVRVYRPKCACACECVCPSCFVRPSSSSLWV
jgi:hypothetical protein